MNKQLSFLSVFEIKPFQLFCILFTISAIITALLSLIFEIEIQVPFNRMILDISVICGAPVLALMILNAESISKRIDEMENDVVISLLLHFIITIGFVVLACFVLIPFTALPDDFSLGIAIWNAVFSMIQSYVITLLCAKIIDIHKTAVANRSLKIIQNSLKNVQHSKTK